MKGLLVKDFMALKKNLKIYLIFIIFYILIGIKSGNSSMFSTMLTIVSVLTPITAMSYDERSKWDRYALTMPLSRGSIVLSKYVLGMFFLVVAFILITLFNLFFINIPPMVNIMSTIRIISVGIIYMSILFPLVFKLGVEKGRIYMMLVAVVPAGIMLLLPNLGFSILSSATIIKMFMDYLPVIAALILATSYLMTLSIYKNKEF